MSKQFKLGETYYNNQGSSIRIICVDSLLMHSGINKCSVVGEVTPKGSKYPSQVLYFNEKGWYCGLDPKAHKTYEPYCLISNEPNEEEAELIREIGNLCERIGDDREERLLKVIRQLRKK